MDTREQRPFSFRGTVKNGVEVQKLNTGDYSVKGLEGLLAIERKSLDDLVACCGRERERFERELERLRAYACRLGGMVICEGSYEQIEKEAYRSRIKKRSVIGSLTSWQSNGVPIIMAGTRKRAELLTYTALRIAYNKAQWRLKHLDEGKTIPA